MQIIFNYIQKLLNYDFFSTVLETIIATLIATFFVYIFNKIYVQKCTHQGLKQCIQNLYIGSNKAWIDFKLGVATFTNQAENYLECVYITNIAAVRVYYDSANSCKAFFVTSLSKKNLDSIMLPTQYSWIAPKKRLGKFSFYEIDFSPLCYFGFVSNGVGRVLYGEEYEFQSSGNYYSFYFMILGKR